MPVNRPEDPYSFSLFSDKTHYERVSWWVPRSLSPDYQKAYDKASEAIPFKKDQVVLEIAPGIGEMARRVQVKVRKLFALDVSPEMLTLCQKNLQRRGVLVEQAENPQTKEQLQQQLNRPGVTLMQGDVFNNTLPKDQFDHVFYTFSDFRTAQPTALMRNFVDLKLATSSGESLSTIKTSAMWTQALFSMALLVKQGGLITVVDYGLKIEGFESVRRALGQMLYIRKFMFIPAPELRDDTEARFTDTALEEFGYRILILGKKYSTAQIESMIEESTAARIRNLVGVFRVRL